MELDPADYSRLLKPILEGETNVVYGSRFLNNSYFNNNPWTFCCNRVLTIIANLITGQRLTDEATCYKMFKREVLIGLNLQENGFGFCPEVTVKLARSGIKIVEVPIHYYPRSRKNGKKIHFWHGIEAIFCLLKHNRSRGIHLND